MFTIKIILRSRVKMVATKLLLWKRVITHTLKLMMLSAKPHESGGKLIVAAGKMPKRYGMSSLRKKKTSHFRPEYTDHYCGKSCLLLMNNFLLRVITILK